MKKKLICFLMAIAVAVSLFTTVMADGGNIAQIYDGTATHDLYSEPQGNGWNYDEATNTLTLNNFSGISIFFFTNSEKQTLTVILENDNSIEHFASDGYDIIFEGSGTLNICGGVVDENSKLDTYGYVKTETALDVSRQSITVNSGTLNVSPTARDEEPGELYHGIVCRKGFVQNGGVVHITLPDPSNTYYEDIDCDNIVLNGGVFSSNKKEDHYYHEQDELLHDEWISYPNGEEYQVNATAKLTSSQIFVNGVPIQFEAYNINDNNYFKLRDIAYVLSGTGKQFDVAWEHGSIMLKPNKAYTIVGGEMENKGINGIEAKLSHVISIGHESGYGNDDTLFRGIYNIADNNYFKLRDVGKYFDFDVSWDSINNAILIDTTKGYTND